MGEGDKNGGWNKDGKYKAYNKKKKIQRVTMQCPGARACFACIKLIICHQEHNYLYSADEVKKKALLCFSPVTSWEIPGILWLHTTLQLLAKGPVKEVEG